MLDSKWSSKTDFHFTLNIALTAQQAWNIALGANSSAVGRLWCSHSNFAMLYEVVDFSSFHRLSSR